MESGDALYDQASTVFSPDGRLYQVEYAREAVNKGSTTLGMKFKDGVVLIAHKDSTSNLIKAHTIDKIFQIDDHIGCAFSGLVADAQRLVEIARDEAQVNRLAYDEQIPVKALVEIICEYKHLYTQFDGIRPFGVALIIAGVDESGKRLFDTDPSGAFLEYKAICEGSESQSAMSHLNRFYAPNLTLDAAINLGLQALRKTTKKKLTADCLEIAIIDKKEKFYKLPTKKIGLLLKKE